MKRRVFAPEGTYVATHKDGRVPEDITYYVGSPEACMIILNHTPPPPKRRVMLSVRIDGDLYDEVRTMLALLQTKRSRRGHVVSFGMWPTLLENLLTSWLTDQKAALFPKQREQVATKPSLLSLPESRTVEARETTPAAYSVMEFCRAYGLGRSTFYRLQSAGHAPRIMAIGRRRLITREAADEWRREMEHQR